jgi:hypothetical protein
MPGKGTKRKGSSPGKTPKKKPDVKKSLGGAMRVRRPNPGTGDRKGEPAGTGMAIKKQYLLTEGEMMLYQEEKRGDEAKVDITSDKYKEACLVPEGTWIQTDCVQLPDVMKHLSGSNDGQASHAHTRTTVNMRIRESKCTNVTSSHTHKRPHRP